jgi:hypothetical protein
LIDLTNRLKFITRKVDFYISSISGLVIYQNDLPVNLTIRGLGFGYIPNDDYLMEIFIEGKKIPSDLFQIQKDYELSVSIPQEIISPFYDNDSLKYINGSIKITKREKLLKPRKEYNINIKLTILPKIAGFLEFEEIIIDQIFGPETSYDLVKNVSGSSTKSPNDWSQQWGNAPTNSTITRVTYECAGRGCGWCYNPNGGYKVNYSLSMNNTMVTVRRHCDGKSCIVTHNIFYITKVDTTYTLSHSKILLEFNKQYTIKLDKKNTNHHYKLTGKTFLNQPIYMDNSSFSRPVGPITGTGQGNYGDNFEISILTKGVRDFITQ